MKDKIFWKYNKKKLIFCISITILIFFYLVLSLLNYKIVRHYDNVVFPNSYLQDYGIGNYSYDSLKDFIDFLNGIVDDKKIIFVIDGKEYKYKYSDIGLYLNTEKIIKEIEISQKKLSYFKKLQLINDNSKKIYNYKFTYSTDSLKAFLNKIKASIDRGKVDGHFVDDGSKVYYDKGTDGFFLDIDKSYEVIIKALENGLNDDTKIELVGNIDKVNVDERYTSVDTMVSSFTTEFDQYIYARAKNLYTALNYINGAVINPGEEFSYYKYAGPYNKRGYVFYYEFVGNGVCQIATTVYNAALLGGLEITKRYPHAAKSVYVPGGLDATVASYSSGWYVDMAFKNTYDYPIYIKAYANNGKATVEFWSNKDAKKGYTYETESVQIGYRGYKSYLHVFKDGVEVEKRFIATTWYSKD